MMLVTRVGNLACALPIEHVIEIMRPLPIEPIARPSDHPVLVMIEGLAMIRGVPVPVIDVRRLLGATGERATRVVVIRVQDRQLAMLVDEVCGVQHIEQEQLARLPPLLGGVNRDSISAIGARDAALLIVLDAARVVPEDSWRALDTGPGAGPCPGDRGEP
jgi:purine-binding chemotaxis protein CheW